MKLLALLLVLCVLQNEVVQSGVILGTLNKIGSTAKCTGHKVKNFFFKPDQEKEPCGNEDDTGKSVTPLEIRDDITTSNNYLIDIRAGDVTTESVHPTVSEGRRLISAGSNCAEGYRADSNGHCREEY